MKAIGINAHLLARSQSYRRAGIHVYQAGVLNHLEPLPGHRYKIFTQAERSELFSKTLNLYRSRLNTANPLLRIFWEQMVWGMAARRQRCELLHSMAFVLPLLTWQAGVVTVFDLSFIFYPERYPTLRRLYLTTQAKRSCQKATRVIAISRSGKRDIHTHFGIPLHKIDVVYPGLNRSFSRPDQSEIARFRQQSGLPERFLLHIGTLQPRKNLSVLIKAFSQLKEPNLHLVLVGGKGWFYETLFAQVEQLRVADRVHFAGYVDDAQLPLWYAAAEAFVFPSVYEGFGMPIVEAMACGTPVIASNASAMPEACGSAALQFNPHEVGELVDRIRLILENREQTAKMRADGLQQAAHFSWEAAGRQTTDIYRKILYKSDKN